MGMVGAWVQMHIPGSRLCHPIRGMVTVPTPGQLLRNSPWRVVSVQQTPAVLLFTNDIGRRILGTQTGPLGPPGSPGTPKNSCSQAKVESV